MLTVQLLGRWASDVVARCVAESPLKVLTCQFRQSAASADLRGVLGRIHSNDPGVTSVIAELDDRTKRLTQDDIDFRELIRRSFPVGAKRGAHFVISRLRKVHVPASRYYPEASITSWRARCGWLFGLAEHEPAASVPADARLCAACMRGHAAIADEDSCNE